LPINKYDENEATKIHEEMIEDDGEFDCNVSGTMGSSQHTNQMMNDAKFEKAEKRPQIDKANTTEDFNKAAR